MKFDTQSMGSDGIKIAFRESDGTKTENVFSKTSTVKVGCPHCLFILICILLHDITGFVSICIQQDECATTL